MSEGAPASGLQSYRDTLRRRGEEERRQRAQRSRQARRVAERVATLLKEQFGARRVVVFGSAATGRLLHASSDVDLAVWGLSATAHLEAVAQVQACSPHFEVDLIRMEHCPVALEDAILRDGLTL